MSTTLLTRYDPLRMPEKIRTVLFDLDGTLADTAPDLGFALNTLVEEAGRPPVPYAAIRAQASHGARGLIQLGFGVSVADPDFDALRSRFLKIYGEHLCDKTVLFPGMADVLAALQKNNLNWGIVTNKPSFFTDRLVRALQLEAQASCVVSGDTTKNSKPHPEPLLFACAKAGSTPHQCLYVGDAARDIEAGRRAGMKTLIALFGYLHPEDQPNSWGADGMIQTPQEILAWLDKNA